MSGVQAGTGGLPAVSVLVSSRGRRARLREAVASLRRLDYPRDRLEIVVVEETASPEPIPGVRYVAIPERGLGYGHSRNVAVRHATHDVLAFTDDDCEPDPGWLRALVAPLAADPAIAGAAGAVLVRGGGVLGRCESVLGFPGGGLRALQRAGGAVRPTRWLSTCNCAYRRRVLEEAGGFDGAARHGGEDSALAARITARHRCVFVPGAVVYHDPRGSLPGIFGWFVRRGRAEVDRALAEGGLRRWLRVGPPASIGVKALAAAGLAAAAGASGPAPAAAPAVLGLLGALWYGAAVARAAGPWRLAGDVRVLLAVPVVKAVMDLGMDWGRLRELAARGRRR